LRLPGLLVEEYSLKKQEAAQVEKASEGVLMAKKILVIEDDSIALRLIEYTLRKEGYQVLTAKNGLEGISKAKSGEPDLIILDVMLPGVDGFEVCHRLRSEPKTAQLPILMLSGKAQEIDKATGLKVGADDYITKPATPRELVSRIESHLTRKMAAKSKIIAFLGTKCGVGTTTMVVNVAVTLSQKGKRVIVADLSSYNGNLTEHLGLKPEKNIAELLGKPVDTIKHRELEAALAVYQSGVRVIASPHPGENGKECSPSNVNLLFGRLREVTDYLLVDLTAPLSELGKATLSKCDLVIIVTDFKAGALPDLKSTSALLQKMGVSKERLGAVLIDREATFPEKALSNMRSIIEMNTKVSLLGVIPYEIKASLEAMPGTIPLIISNPNSPMAWSIREVASHIS
jgi:DNA-binding response OmpR family regulator